VSNIKEFLFDLPIFLLNFICKPECAGPDHNQLTHRKNKKLSNVAELKYVQTHCGFPADILDF
jgi:hypothetical protein